MQKKWSVVLAQPDLTAGRQAGGLADEMLLHLNFFKLYTGQNIGIQKGKYYHSDTNTF